MSPLKSFIDTDVLIAAARGNYLISSKAIQILEDPNREFVSSVFIQLEALPKPVFNKKKDEVDFYKEFFKVVSYWAEPSEALTNQALILAEKYGLGGMDALHVAAAISVGADELVTGEGPTTSLHRVTEIQVITIRD